MQVQRDVALGALIQNHRVLSTAHTVKACSQIPNTSYTTKHHIIVIIITYITLYSLKHSAKPILSYNPQNKPLRTE